VDELYIPVLHLVQQPLPSIDPRDNEWKLIRWNDARERKRFVYSLRELRDRYDQLSQRNVGGAPIGIVLDESFRSRNLVKTVAYSCGNSSCDKTLRLDL
jgi:hypothetical protein